MAPTAKACATCKKEQSDNLRLLACARCQAVFYCGTKCQKEDWMSRHNRVCTGKKSKREEQPQTSAEEAAPASPAAAKDGAVASTSSPQRAAAMPSPHSKSAARPAGEAQKKGKGKAPQGGGAPNASLAEHNRRRHDLEQRFMEGTSGIASKPQAETLLQMVDRMSQMQDIPCGRPWKESYSKMTGPARCIIALDGTWGTSPKYIMTPEPILVEWDVVDLDSARFQKVRSISPAPSTAWNA
jgi:hypothetical protein